MGTPVIRPVLFFSNVTASVVSTAINMDYRYDEDRLRSISGTRADVNDEVQVLVETVVKQYHSNGTELTDVVVTATATTFDSTNGTVNSCVLQGPFTRVKVHKTGASGAATFVGIV